MSFAVVGAVVAGGAGLATAIGGAALGAVGAVGSTALSIGGLGVSAASGLVSGVGSLFAGPAAAGVTVGESMAAIAQPAYYEAGADVLGGVAAAAGQTVGALGQILPAVGGIYSIMNPPEAQTPIPRSTGTLPSPSIKTPGVSIPNSPLPIFSQSPKVMTVGGTAEKTPGPNYMIYIALAVVAYVLLRKK